MKKIALLLLALLAAAPAHAGVSCSVPFNLQNATVADATQVMANYNAIITCLGNAAAAGANNDITSLSALSTPITPAQGGTTQYVGSTSTGTNAQVVATTTPSIFALQAGRTIVFVAGSGNTGPTTLNVASSGTINLFRRTQLGVSAMVGGEIIAGQPVVAVYDGTQYVLMSGGPYQVGEIRNYAGTTAPIGWAFIDGTCATRTQYPDLFTVIGTAFDPGSACDTAHFALPDGRGRALVGKDDMGGVAANRITNAATGCTGTTIGGAGCGNQIVTLARSDLPNVSVTTSQNVSGVTAAVNNNTGLWVFNSGSGLWNGGGGGNTGTPGITITEPNGGLGHSHSFNLNNNVTQTNVNKLPPLQVVTQIIKR